MAATLKEILARETEVWEALKLGRPDLDAALLSDDFLGVYPTGFASKTEHCRQLENGPTVMTYEISHASLRILSEKTALLSYLATWVRAGAQHAASSEQMYISSLWEHVEDRWINTFSQDTPASISRTT